MQRATAREWIGLAVLALACLLYVMDLTVLHLAVPAISEDLRPTQHPAAVDHRRRTASWWPARWSRWALWATGSAGAGC